jgi:hypothetical protein
MFSLKESRGEAVTSASALTSTTKGMISMIEADRVHSTPRTDSSSIPEGPSRRGMLAGLAVLPVVGIPGAASTTGADAELIALGKRLEPLVDAYYTARQPWALAMVQYDRELKARFGDPADRNYQDTPEIVAAAKEISARFGLDKAADQLSAVWEELKPVAVAIDAMPCMSIEGLS